MSLGKLFLLGGIFVGALWSGSVHAAGPTCPEGAIKLGAISTVTGPADFSEVPKAAKAMYDAVNAAGGINGCKIDYEIADDKADPQVAAQAARNFIDNKKVVAMSGSASVLECAVNAPTYKRANVLSVHGLGVDPVCFNSPNIAPVNVGPYTLSTAMALFASSALKAKAVCAMFVIIGGTQEAYKAAIARWEQVSGEKAKLVDLTVPLSGDFTPFVVKARDAGCDAVVVNEIEPAVVAWMKIADAQKISGINWLFLAPGYTAEVAKALADSKQSIYVGTEWEPYTEQNLPANKEWLATMTAAKQPLTAFSQGGFLSAQVMLDVIKSIDGPVTRESINKALLAMMPQSYPLAGSPFVFGPGATHAPMQAVKVMKLQNGGWTVETKDWMVVPAK
ncbi:ABC transporter substrate-binding protein [Bradyrhizobium sp. KB893862 SZCCT0404]|uniref:ABC transporter substrate-binding protein n=1 Tax=Bradyrhizobium sp. KB893862 SZCCT0404 TaxID=2807672 RepID=UPI001BA4BAB8|nr:ABC transporter substrate-binding protein [Bradyrhizobium sp. KB893862 SZCCT0404]MBR1177170.1 ABC transporter substrate-binding protein [Bradyrhizobium sp. KB893862 SZCCT0404]